MERLWSIYSRDTDRPQPTPYSPDPLFKTFELQRSTDVGGKPIKNGAKTMELPEELRDFLCPGNFSLIRCYSGLDKVFPGIMSERTQSFDDCYSRKDVSENSSGKGITLEDMPAYTDTANGMQQSPMSGQRSTASLTNNSLLPDVNDLSATAQQNIGHGSNHRNDKSAAHTPSIHELVEETQPNSLYTNVVSINVP